MRTARRPAPRRPSGFTLMEVMIALLIMSMVMVALYATLNATLQARDQIETESRAARLGPQLLDIIEADIRRAWILGIEGDNVFLGESRTIDGEPADSLTLLTNVDSTLTRRVGDREAESDVCETGYRLRRNPVLQDVMELARRQSFHVDEEPLKDGLYEVLHDRVVRFKVRYRDRIEQYGEELQDWDASKMHRLPALVEIELAIEAVPRTLADMGRKDAASRTLVYKRSIPLGRDTAMVMRVHPVAPTFIPAGGVAGGANDTDGEDDEDGGKGDDGGDGGKDGQGGSGKDNDDDPFGGFGGGSGGGGSNPGDFGDFLDDLFGSGGGG